MYVNSILFLKAYFYGVWEYHAVVGEFQYSIVGWMKLQNSDAVGLRKCFYVVKYKRMVRI